MDKRQKTIDVVKTLHDHQEGKVDTPELIKVVCNYYDYVKDKELFEGDLQFLSKIANIAGIPHYFDNLNDFQDKEVSLTNFSLSTISSQIYESTLYTTDDSKVHQYQKDILSLFTPHKKNRYFLSASTSFGKTHLVYEIIRKINYENIVLIFPSIALLTENLERMHGNILYESYKIHTLSDVTPEEMKGKNIFIYTPERFLSFLEKSAGRPTFDFIFIDEVYKIDNEYIIDEDEKKENERDVSYRIAAFYSVIENTDLLLAGPYIEKHSASFERFLNHNKINKCDFNQYEIVGKSFHEVKTARKLDIGEGIVFEFSKDENGKQARLQKIIGILCEKGDKEGSIIYCPAPSSAERYAKCLPSLVDYESLSSDYQLFVEHISKEYGNEWVVTTCLKKGIGVHHGLIPKYIQKEIINFFNKGILKVLTSTTTITEGVNTSAKNLIVINNRKGTKTLKRFDAKNIAGRAGRFNNHYSGRVIILQNKFLDDLNSEKESIHHKNYDLDSQKDEIDLFYSGSEFLTEEDKSKREKIILEQKERGIPDEILDMFKVVSKTDKIEIYDRITSLDSRQHSSVINLIRKINSSSQVSIEWDGLQVILDCIHPIVNTQLAVFIDQKTNQGTGEHSILVPMLYNYLEEGFKGLVIFKREKRGESIDEATRNTARFVFNTAKYQLVKYLGVFNVMYKFYRSRSEGIEFEEISGIDRLLTKLEYNALTVLGRKASDYGVPTRVLQYYESEKSSKIKSSFDKFEEKSFDIVEGIINR